MWIRGHTVTDQHPVSKRVREEQIKVFHVVKRSNFSRVKGQKISKRCYSSKVFKLELAWALATIKVVVNWISNNMHKKQFRIGREPWSSGYGKRLTI